MLAAKNIVATQGQLDMTEPPSACRDKPSRLAITRTDRP